jgi:hypothetical protein
MIERNVVVQGKQVVPLHSDDVADVLFLAGIEAMENVSAMSAGVSRGPYGENPKSKDWLVAALQSPDRDF